MERTLRPALEKLKPFLEEPSITDLCFNHSNAFFVDRGEGMERVENPSIFDGEHELRAFVLDEISKSGRTWDAKLPFLDTIFFGTHRAHIAFPPLSRGGLCLSLRRLPSAFNINDPFTASNQAIARWRMTSAAFWFLKEAVLRKESILISGGTGSGKTTLLNDLLQFVPASERMIAIEDTAEIQPMHPHFIGLLSRNANADGCGAVSMRELVRQTLRMRPDRILIGECRGNEIFDLLQALNTGHRGSLCTIHSNSGADALKRAELLALMAAEGKVPLGLIRELIFRGIRWVAHLEKHAEGRRISSITGIDGIERETFLLRPVFPESQSAQMRPSLR
jgi:pilus assembly protein CpaF